jgi:predicted ATPase/class 3 adenylate cyclase
LHDPSAVTTFLFTDIEGSTRLWEGAPERMQPALKRHDALARTVVEGQRGTIVKMTGDGMCAAFGDPVDAVGAAVTLQQALADPINTGGVTLPVRCGLHVGVVERRDNDFFGRVLNRTARLMAAAHGGQVLVSQAVAALVGDRLPPPVELRDLGLVRLRDLAAPEHVFQLVHPLLRRDFPALRSLDARPNNLPQQMTSFVGRERELSDVKARLAGTRLLTLVGVGGLGKTRLSLQVAADVLDDYPDGVWFVELAPLADPDRVAQAVASVLAVVEDAGRPVQEALAKFVKDRRLLIILDNCEHLLQACAELARDLLHAGPGVKVLTSSREPLHLTGETSYPLPSLAVPDRHGNITPAALTQYEAVHLFTDRALAVKPAFQVTQENASAIAEICHRLDGIPLALELAAARVRALSVEQIATRLSDRFRLLTSGDRTAMPRQQTLRACIDWSYDLLTAPERTLLQRLSAFAGGWTLEAAEAIGAGGDIGEPEVIDLLMHLVDKSLVISDAERGRYQMLETVRQYAQERLNQLGSADDTRARHLAYYLALAEKARPELAGPQQGVWLAQLDLERENLLTANAWCDRNDEGARLGLKLVHSVKPYWFVRGLLGLGQRVTVDALARAGAQERSLLRCQVLADAGQLGCWMGRYADARGYLEESLAIAREIGDQRMVAAVLQPLGIATLGQGDMAASRRHLDEALALARTLGNKRELLAAVNALAQLLRVEGNLDAAEPLYENVLVLARELGDRESIAIGLLNLAMVAIGRGSCDRAKHMLLEVMAIAEEIGSKPAGQSVLEVSAGLGALLQQWERAARLFGIAEAQTEQTGLHRDPADDAFLVPLMAKAREALGAAGFAAAELDGRALSYEKALLEAREWLENGT